MKKIDLSEVDWGTVALVAVVLALLVIVAFWAFAAARIAPVA